MLKKTKKVPSASATAYTCHIARVSVKAAMGIMAKAKARMTSEMIITRLRSQRSTRAPTGRLRRRYGTEKRAPTIPASWAEPVR
jgi:hypothetical protein